MKSTDLTIDTPFENITSRHQLVTLAQITFAPLPERSTPAFGQFLRNDDLKRIIQAKRDGVFNYGVTIRRVDTGVAYPNPSSTIEVLTLVEDKKCTPEDMVKLGLLPSDYEDVCMLREPVETLQDKREARAAEKKKKAAKTPEAEEVEVVKRKVHPSNRAPVSDHGDALADVAAQIGEALKVLDNKLEVILTNQVEILTNQQNLEDSNEGLVNGLRVIFNITHDVYKATGIQLGFDVADALEQADWLRDWVPPEAPAEETEEGEEEPPEEEDVQEEGEEPLDLDVSKLTAKNLRKLDRESLEKVARHVGVQEPFPALKASLVVRIVTAVQDD